MNFKMVQLNQLCSWVDEKVALSSLDCDTYVSTENMLKNRGGICLASSVPEGGNAQAFKCGDILISNIRPYFKKIWMAKCSGGCSNDVLVLRSKPDVNALWLYYVLSSDDFFDYDTANSGGGKMPRGSKSAIMKYEVTVPDIEVQQKMAEVLRSYDVAIGNNRCRIALLEKMARELYRERFVRRVGKDQATFSLEQIAKFVRGRVIVKDATKPGGVPVVAGGLEPAYYHDTANTEAPVVTVSGSGANAGFARMYFEKVWASDCSWVDATTTKYIRFVYCFLRDKDAELRNAQKGAAQPHVHAKDVNVLVVTAGEERIAEFENIVTPLFDELANLTFQNRNLARQRDRLLPRLMSGKIDLDKLVKGEEVENG